MFDHIGIVVSNIARSRAFYEAALAPLGIHAEEASADLILFRGGMHIFSISTRGEVSPSAVHLAFAAQIRAGVDEFYEAGLGAGGRDNGEPGIRPEYSENYYAAFLLDPDGYNVEAVCHGAA